MMPTVCNPGSIMPNPRDVLTPEALRMLQVIETSGSFAAAARSLDMVPSALTYRVRQIEEALDVLLFDRSSRSARLTEAGSELLREAHALLGQIDAIANRVRRVATGWEPQLTIAIDSIIDARATMELCAAFFELNPPTRLKLRNETLAGTLEALNSGEADIAIGVVMDDNTKPGLLREAIGEMDFVFAMTPHHPLAKETEPLSDATIRQHRAVAIADSTREGNALSVGLLAAQDVFTVADLPSKLDAQLRGLGVGFLPAHLAQAYVDTGRLVARRVARAEQRIQACYAWRKTSQAGQGRALKWWLTQLASPITRAALLGRRRPPPGTGESA